MTRRKTFIDKTPKRRQSTAAAPAAEETAPPNLIEQAFESAVEDDDAVDATILASDSVIDVVKKYAQLRHRKAIADGKVDEIKAEMNHLEEWILEQMAGEMQNMKVNVEIDGETKPFTVYQIADKTVWKAKGIDTSDLCRALESVGWGALVGETVNSRSLKASVKEAMNQKKEGLFADADQWYCPNCDSYYGADSVTTYCDSVTAIATSSTDEAIPACGTCSEPEKNHFVLLVEIGETGIPKKLETLLTIEDVKKLGVRRA